MCIFWSVFIVNTKWNGLPTPPNKPLLVVYGHPKHIVRVNYKVLTSPEFKCNFIILICSLFSYRASLWATLTPNLQWNRETSALQRHSKPTRIYLHWQWFRPRKATLFPPAKARWSNRLRFAYGCCLVTTQRFIKLPSALCYWVPSYSQGERDSSAELLSSTNLLY